MVSWLDCGSKSLLSLGWLGIVLCFCLLLHGRGYKWARVNCSSNLSWCHGGTCDGLQCSISSSWVGVPPWGASYNLQYTYPLHAEKSTAKPFRLWTIYFIVNFTLRINKNLINGLWKVVGDACLLTRTFRLLHTEEGLYTRNVCVNRHFWHFLITFDILRYQLLSKQKSTLSKSYFVWDDLSLN